MSKWMKETTLKRLIAKELIDIGFRTYTDTKIDKTIKTFHSKREYTLKKPDIIVVANSIEKRKTLEWENVSPIFGIELKIVKGFNTLTNAISQMRNYKNMNYIVDGFTVKLKNIFLATDKIKNGSVWHDKDQSLFDEFLSIDCVITRFLYGLRNVDNKKLFFGIMTFKNNHFWLEFPNVKFQLQRDGVIR